MTIETKFNYGDIVWYMTENKPHKIEITEFKAECIYSGYSELEWGSERTYPIRFWYRDGQSRGGDKTTGWIPEYSLFKSKEELLASL